MVKSGHAYRFVALSRQFGLKLITSSEVPKGRCTMIVHTDDVDKVKKLIGGDVINDAFENASKVMSMHSLINTAMQSVVIGSFFLCRGPKAAYKEVSDRIFPTPPSVRVEMADSIVHRTQDIYDRMRAGRKGGSRIKAGARKDDDGGGSDGGPDGGSDGGSDGGPDGGDLGDYQSYLDVMEKLFNFHSSCFTDAIPLHKLQQDNKYCLPDHLSKEGGWNHYAAIKADHNGALVYCLMSELLGARARNGLTGLTVANHIREVKGQDVLCFIGHFFHFTQGNSEVFSLLGPMLSAATFSHLDAVTLLSRQISELGIYAYVDPLFSTPRMLSPHTLGEELYNTAGGVSKVLQNYKIQGILLAILGMNDPFHVAERVLDGKYVDAPALSFNMVGGIEEVIAKAEMISEESTGTHLMT